MVPVEPVDPEVPRSLGESPDAAVATAGEVAGAASRHHRVRVAALVVMVLGGLGLWLRALPTTTSMAVVPFRNLGGDLEIDYFSAGVTEDITARLSQVRQLRVKPLAKASLRAAASPRAAASARELAPLDLSRLGRSANVEAVLDGSVRREGERIRVVARLVEVESGEILWAHAYDRRLEGIFDIQQELANRIAVALEARLSSVERQRLEPRRTNLR